LRSHHQGSDDAWEKPSPSRVQHASRSETIFTRRYYKYGVGPLTPIYGKDGVVARKKVTKVTIRNRASRTSTPPLRLCTARCGFRNLLLPDAAKVHPHTTPCRSSLERFTASTEAPTPWTLPGATAHHQLLIWPALLLHIHPYLPFPLALLLPFLDDDAATSRLSPLLSPPPFLDTRPFPLRRSRDVRIFLYALAAMRTGRSRTRTSGCATTTARTGRSSRI